MTADILRTSLYGKVEQQELEPQAFRVRGYAWRHTPCKVEDLIDTIWGSSGASADALKSALAKARRAMLYLLAVETGLRQNELRSLTRSSFALDADEPTVTIQAAYAKN